jgi:hypothetical protein
MRDMLVGSPQAMCLSSNYDQVIIPRRGAKVKKNGTIAGAISAEKMPGTGVEPARP